MKFQGLTRPFTTPVPDEFFDVLLGRIDSLAELKVVLYVLRRTFGFGKLVDRISYSQFCEGIRVRRGVEERRLDEGTGLTRQSVSEGLSRAIAHGYLVRYVVCPRCDHQVSASERGQHQPPPDDAVPYKCPHCGQRLRGRAHLYYAMPLSPANLSTELSTKLSTPVKDLDYSRLKSLTRGSLGFIPVLVQILDPQETDKQETDNKKQSVVVVLSAFGFNENDSQAIADEAIKAGLSEVEVEAWLDYIRRQRNLSNPKGFLRSKLRTGQVPPSDESDRYRYVRGRYAGYVKH
jgi:DNA-directed RNA polymerase subunit RPC12/RpoP